MPSEPRDGGYDNGAGDSLQVSAGYVVSFFFFSGTSSPCGIGPANNVQAPIDPQTGQFSFTSTNPQTQPPATTTAKGTFSDATDMTLDATIAYGELHLRRVPDRLQLPAPWRVALRRRPFPRDAQLRQRDRR